MIPALVAPYTAPTDAVGWDKGVLDSTALLTTTDKAQLDITSDVCLIACIRPDQIATGSYQRIFGKWGASGAFSYGLGLSPTGQITLHLSPNGTTLSNENSGATAPLTGLLDDGEKFWIAGAVDSTNAATTGRDKKYWWRRDGDTAWTQLGVTQTNTPAQNIFSGAGDLSIGRLPGDTTSQFNGTIYNVEVYNGIGAFTAPGQGTLVASANMRTPWTADSYSDGLGNTWTRANGTWKADPLFTVATATGLTGARFPHRASDTTVMVPDSLGNSLSVWSFASGNNIVLKGSTGSKADLTGARSAVVDATGAYAFVVSLESDYFAVYDLRSDVPQPVAAIQDAVNLNGARGIIREGNYCFVTARDGDRVTSVKVTDPTNPVVVSSITHANLDDVRGLAYINGYVLAAANTPNRITSIDVSNPENLVYGSSLQDNTNLSGIHEIAIFEDAAICACVNSPGRITSVDVHDPLSMSVTGSLSLGILTQSMYSLEVDAVTGYVYVSNLDLGWVVMADLNNTGAVPSFLYAVRPGTLTTGGGVYLDPQRRVLIVVSYDEGTIALMKISGQT